MKIFNLGTSENNFKTLSFLLNLYLNKVFPVEDVLNIKNISINV